ncbi:MAG: hypothetical protein ABMB14_25155, partial [Myxococcota bacterium]
LPIGSFHPGHRAKWTAHELCHGLVGFAWRPGASPLFHATAARLAELVPVVTWYFLDEVGLRRCPRHTGPLFRGGCADCAQAASEPGRVDDPARAERAIRDASAFVDAELAAVARTSRLGRPAPHVWGSIDLCSDGIAYAGGHAPRLNSRSFAAFAERFPPIHPSLDALEARAIDVVRAIAEGRPLDPCARDWAAWDLGQRLLDVWEECDGEAAELLLGLVDDLADGVAPATVYAGYAALFDDYELAPPDEVFAVGYDLPGPIPTRSVAQLADGLKSVTPTTLMVAEDAGIDLVTPFAAADRFERVPLGVRFARWLAGAHPGPVADLARYEASLRTARGEAEAGALGLAGTGWRLADGAEVHRYPFDVARLAEQVDAGEVSGAVDPDGRLSVPVDADDGGPVGLVVSRTATGDLVVAEIPADADPVDDAEVRSALVGLGVVVPARWSVDG